MLWVFFFFPKDYVTKLSILDILEGPGNFNHPALPHHSSLLCACCHSCDVIFLFIYHVCLKRKGFLLQVCDSLASGRLNCRLGRQQGAPVLFGEPPLIGQCWWGEWKTVSPVAMIKQVWGSQVRWFSALICHCSSVTRRLFQYQGWGGAGGGFLQFFFYK